MFQLVQIKVFRIRSTKLHFLREETTVKGAYGPIKG